MEQAKLNIGIILGSTREGRVSQSVGEWFKKIADQRNDASFEILDLRDYQLPFLGESEDMTNVIRWNQKLASKDGFIFILPEYNHGIPAVLKNALDSAKEAWNNKAAGIVSYGSAGGARSAEHLRGVLGELQIADVRTQILLTLFNDFENFKIFKPLAVHQANVTILLDQLVAWARALKTVRSAK